MNASHTRTAAGGDVSRRLAFFKGLQAITNRIHSALDIDQIVFELASDICALFDAERLSIYTLDDGGDAIVTKVKIGLRAVRNIRLPIDEQSIAGYVACRRTLVNIADVYDEDELHALSPALHFRKDVDERSGFHTQAMLAAPIVEPESGQLEGVIQFMNAKDGGRFSTVAEEGLLGLVQALGVAFAKHRTAPAALRSRFDGLVADGRVTVDELGEATRLAREQGMSTERMLIDDYGLSHGELGEAAARFYGVPYEPYRADRIKPMDLLRHIKREYVQQTHWLPLEEAREGLVIMAVDPEQIRTSRIANNVFPRARLAFRVTTRDEFERTVNQFFESSLDAASVDDLLSDLAEEEHEASISDDVNAAVDNELVKLVNKIIIDAHRQGASDIHIEPRPGKDKTLIRFRRDGALVPYIEVPASYRNPLVTRIKIMCDLDISERRRPQDGKIRFRKYAPLDIELRVATLPTAGGTEDVVMRILASNEPIPLDRLGLSSANHARLREVISQPYGIFFVCGPTGSGKTTTLHSILGFLNTPEAKIWTAEDPVEITQKGLRQVQVNRKAGLDFAVLMRAFLRADPDIIMVGEMRDQETMSIGIEASLTGHLVLTTLHTNSAPESIVRLLDMGMDPFNFSDALLGVLAQRLARRLCTQCREAYHPDEAEIGHLLDEYCADMHLTPEFQEDPHVARVRVLSEWRANWADEQGRFTLYRPVGCQECNKGYRGRVGLHELMIGTDAIRQLVQERAHVRELFARALEQGMRTLRQDGIEKVLAGITDLAQVRKVCMR
ncbi:GspE/PulE family protein [Pseudothauera rhizosphaerae]|uniref:GspE/PulE family protein n=1 Tax=Pseudothauera rhizosphaerae TaxID=2565932 RepID=A0A4S4APQ0_9RHOO|nr:GspE/PulE family protein [Pseudothauera rhizosphaerae]THF61675.1 GspE/PulE family protein [Pseudothauera rhizosphaerae]